MKHRRFATLAAAAAALSAQSALAAPIAIVDNGLLVGMDDVVFDGAAWSVRWSSTPESCNDVYGTSLCTTVGSAFQFTQTQAYDATLALSEALSTQDLTLIPGHTQSGGNSFTSVATPYAVTPQTVKIGPITKVVGQWDYVYSTAGMDASGGNHVGSAISTSTYHPTTLANYAIYSAYTPPAVPEPGTWALMAVGFGFLGLGGLVKANRKPDEADRAIREA